jgi:hypothetical protein
VLGCVISLYEIQDCQIAGIEQGINLETSGKPYGEINIFPAIWPAAVLLFSLLAELILSGSPSNSFHQAIDVLATMFIYGGLIFPVISFYTFKWFVLPVINYLPRVTNNDSYLLNCGIFILLTEILFYLLLVWKNPQGGLYLVATAAIPTGVVALNCAGHFWFSKFKVPSTTNK